MGGWGGGDSLPANVSVGAPRPDLAVVAPARRRRRRPVAPRLSEHVLLIFLGLDEPVLRTSRSGRCCGMWAMVKDYL